MPTLFQSRPPFALSALVASAALLALPSAWAQPLPKATPESQGMSTERLAVISSTMKQEVASNRLPGAVVMVARNGLSLIHISEPTRPY